jgi:GNAT superfamily N-acetyltransferase
MMDKSIPCIGVVMTCPHPVDYPRYRLPEGYTLRPFEDGMEYEWAELQVSVEHFASVEKALARFHRDFAIDRRTLQDRGLFVYDENDRMVASLILWYGTHFGRSRPRIHFTAVAPDHQGNGLCRAMMSLALDMYHRYDLTGGVYVVAQTWSYKALHIYQQFGFKPYTGPQPNGWYSSVNDFEQESRQAWDLIEAKLREYRQLS